MSKILITKLTIATSKRGNDYARVHFVDLTDGTVKEAFLDQEVAKSLLAVDLKDLEKFGDEVTFDAKGEITAVAE